MLRRLFLCVLTCFALSVNGQTPAPQGPVFDAAGHLIAYQYADGKRDTYSYDASWRMIFFSGRDGTLTRYVYKSDGTMQAIKASDKRQ